MKLFGSSGIRRVVDRDFLELTSNVGLAVGGLYPSIVVGRDTRTSGDAVKSAFVSGLLAAGSRVADAGIAPTPALAYAARDFDAGAIITASHNPPEYNGIKLVNPDGSAFDSLQRERIEQLVGDGQYQLAAWEGMGSVEGFPRAAERHVDRILEDTPRDTRLKVVVDCGCGAAVDATPVLLRRMGCSVVELHCTPSGHFPRGIEPIEENLQELMAAVSTEGAHLGLAHDGDADRLAVVDDRGRYVSGDVVMALLARHLGVTKVVTTVDASMLIEDLGFDVVRTKVGDVFVSDVLRATPVEQRADEFGGEPSGCFIFPEMSLCPDGIYAALKIVELASLRPLSELASELPRYVVLRGGMPGTSDVMETVRQRLAARNEGNLETIDGLRLSFDDGWLLIRASGTEPKIRITAEAKDERRAGELCELGRETVNESLREQESASR
jgi:phosphoglucosamine mutase